MWQIIAVLSASLLILHIGLAEFRFLETILAKFWSLQIGHMCNKKKGKACKIKTEMETQGRVKFEEVTSNNNIWNTTTQHYEKQT